MRAVWPLVLFLLCRKIVLFGLLKKDRQVSRGVPKSYAKAVVQRQPAYPTNSLRQVSAAPEHRRYDAQKGEPHCEPGDFTRALIRRLAPMAQSYDEDKAAKYRV